MEQEIKLTDLELYVLKLEVEKNFFPPKQTTEEKKALRSVILKAEKLMDDLDAYDELGNSLTEWYYKKYLAQTKK